MFRMVLDAAHDDSRSAGSRRRCGRTRSTTSGCSCCSTVAHLVRFDGMALAKWSFDYRGTSSSHLAKRQPRRRLPRSACCLRGHRVSRRHPLRRRPRFGPRRDAPLGDGQPNPPPLRHRQRTRDSAGDVALTVVLLVATLLPLLTVQALVPRVAIATDMARFVTVFAFGIVWLRLFDELAQGTSAAGARRGARHRHGPSREAHGPRDCG